MANKYWVGGSGAWNSSTNWRTASGGATTTTAPTTADVAIFDSNSGSPTVSITAAGVCAGITVNTGSNLTTSGTFGITITGSLTFNEAVNWGATGGITFNASTAMTIKSSGSTFRSGITLNGTGGLTLQDTLTTGPNATAGTLGPTSQVLAGTLTLNGFNFNCYGPFNLSSSSTRSIAFGSSNYIYINPGAATVSGLSIASTVLTGFTYTGTSRIILDNSSSGAITWNFGAATAAQSMNYEFTNSATYTATLTAGNALSLNFKRGVAPAASSFTGTLTVNGAVTVYGSVYFSSGMTVSASTNVLTFGATSGTSYFDTSGISVALPVTLNGVGGTLQLLSSVTMGITGNAKNFTITNGTLDVNYQAILAGLAGSTIQSGAGTFTIKNLDSNTTIPTNLSLGTCTLSTYMFFGGALTIAGAVVTLGVNTTVQGVFTFTSGTLSLSTFNLTLRTSSAGSASNRTLNFGTGSYIQVGDVGAGYPATGACWTTGAGVISYSGTPDIRIVSQYGYTVTVSAAAAEANALNFTFYCDGTTINTNGSSFANLTFNNTSYGAYTSPTVNFGATTIYGNLTNTDGGAGIASYAASASTLTFAGSVSRTRTITNSAGPQTFNQPVTINLTGGSLELSNDINFTICTFAGGTWNLNRHNVNCSSSFNPTSTTTRVLNFGTQVGTYGVNWDYTTVNRINVTGSTGTIFNGLTTTGLTVSGSYPLVVIDPATGGGTVTVVPGTGTATTSFNFRFNGTNGAYTLNFLATSGHTALDVDFGLYGTFSGTWTAQGGGYIYGSLWLNGSMTITTSASALSFLGSSTQNTNYYYGTYRGIICNGKTLPFPLNWNGSGIIIKLIDALTCSNSLTLTQGTLDLNGQQMSITTFITAAGTKNLTFNGGQLFVSASGATAFNNAQPTGFTTTLGITTYGTGAIYLTNTAAKTFIGGTTTYNCYVYCHTTGSSAYCTVTGTNTFLGLFFYYPGIAITGSNTITLLQNLNNYDGAANIVLTAATTQTLNGSFNLSGEYYSQTFLGINCATAGSTAFITRNSTAWDANTMYMARINVKDVSFLPTAYDGTNYIQWFGAGSSGRDYSISGGNHSGIVLLPYTGAKYYQISNTSTTSWTLPSDFNPFDNTMYLIGGGGGSSGSVAQTTLKRAGGSGGGGAGCTVLSNYPEYPGTVVPLQIGTGGAGGAGVSQTGAVNAVSLGVSGKSTWFGNLSKPSMWYGNFSGSNYLQMTSGVFPRLTTEDFSFECWIYPTSLANNPVIIEDAYTTATTAGGWWLDITSGGQLAFKVYTGSTTTNVTLVSSSSTPAEIVINKWYHIGVVRYSSYYFFLLVNGAISGVFIYDRPLNLNSGGTQTEWATRIGAARRNNATAGGFIGRISNARLSIGSSFYSGTYSVPKDTLTGGTLCTLNSSTIVDNSGNGYTVTNVGSVTMTQGMTLPYRFAGAGSGGSSGVDSSFNSWGVGGTAGAYDRDSAGTDGGNGGYGGITSTSQAVGGGGAGGAGTGNGGGLGSGNGSNGGNGIAQAGNASGGGGGGSGGNVAYGGEDGQSTRGGNGAADFYDGSNGGLGTTSAGGAGKGPGGGAGGFGGSLGGKPGWGDSSIFGTWGGSPGFGGMGSLTASAQVTGFTSGSTLTISFGGGMGGAGMIATATNGGSGLAGGPGGSGAILIGYTPRTWQGGTKGGQSFFDFIDNF